ncbi:uncharacterized protein BDR25DRAFT_2094 [Lindgomyces ingoldianus]|uniref:Uncharacterized protein n=1 Tax=Lindgomyces ingoldianus TaxID=673940 RepID=A0ACB6REJ9_9PLEO|nr:uncharacterized protein BDR25DRAFT_2094 [Lindgomyces ingoldianus]KAF2477566.1 hypothetical protein BDR25DRAFT_2094 [Lindgomyces ingoldianus]
MSQRDHELMESVHADDQAITVPASPLRRDSMEDADSSLTRKRPRLDSGSRETRSMSTDTAPATTSVAQPVDQPVEMTIRSQPPSSQSVNSTSDANGASLATLSVPSESVPLEESAEDPVVAIDDVVADSPPVVAVDDDEDAEEAMDDYTGSISSFVHIEVDEEAYFRRFPFTHSHHGNYQAALRAITAHFQGANPLEGTVLPQVQLWLEGFPNTPSHWKGYYVEKAFFWDEFAALANKVLVRRFPFGDAFTDDQQSEEDIFYGFLSSYLKLCARLIQVDTAMISKFPPGIYEPVLCYKHLRHLNTIVREEKSAIFQVLAKEYGVDTRTMAARLLQDFIEAPTNGLQHLFAFADVGCDKLTAPLRNGIASWTSQILNSFGWAIFGKPEIDPIFDRSQFHRNVLRFFRKYNEDIQVPSKIVEISSAKEIVLNLANILLDLCLWDQQLAAELAEEFMDYVEPGSPTIASEDLDTKTRGESLRQDPPLFPALAMNAWKFKLLRKYVVKGKMELRVMSIQTMSDALVEIWREYNASEYGASNPVMQYLSDFLLHEEVVDYIISVDSHPQLISRSGNIVGFLVVTHRYSESQTDAIWRTVSNSQDPRVVSAVMTMLRNIVGLMEPPELLYLCSKLYDLPIETYTLEILRFLREISGKFQQKYMDWSGTDPRGRPSNVCIRVMQDTSPSSASTKLTNALHSEAYEQLRQLSPTVGLGERRQIYQECTSHIANRSGKATGSVRAICTLFSGAGLNDASFFKQNPEITRKILEELCSFVEAEKQLGAHAMQIVALEYRLDMLCALLTRAADAIPEDLYQVVWDHVVGKHALSNHHRDIAWSKFSDAVRYTRGHEFWRQLTHIYIPRLEPTYFTSGLFEFVSTISFPVTREKVITEEGETELIQIPGADILWPMVLSAPPGTIEDRSAKLLANRYVDIASYQGVRLEEVEEAQVGLVEQCTKELLTAYKIMRNLSTQALTEDTGYSMDIVPSGEDPRQNELRFTRTLMLEKLLLTYIRTKPEFSRSRRSDSKVDVLEPELPFGDAIEIKYQATNEKQTIFMSTENTLQDLYTRLCHTTGFTKLHLFASGQRLNLTEKAHKKIVDLGLGENIFLLVQKAANSETIQPVADSSANCSVFEATVLKHFEELFACMDADDYISETLFDFLSCFPFRERIAEAVISGTASANDIFPPGKVFQAKYAAFALQFKLREQLRRSSLNESFLANAIHLLSEALLNHSLISESLGGRQELHLAAVLVNVLLEFLKERPRQEISSHYFSNASSLVNRLLKILSFSIQAPVDASLVVSQSYAAILEASLHSREVWEAFVGKEGIPALHRSLLLMDPRKSLREHIVQSIASVCGGDLPSTSPLTGAEAAERYWKIISNILPEAVQHSSQSEQLFDIAEQVFRSHDENSRDEDALRSSLNSWSSLLLNYKHEEFVGRDEIDFVVFGFTKLLLCCIPSLKSFKKPLNAGALMESIFRKFLFVPKVIEIEEGASEQIGLPVLESKTRKELYDLMLALAEDRNSYGMLLQLAQSLANDEETMSLRAYSIERSNEIRSATGYVGLVNPRAICYMNSLLTQLFMNVNFRKFMLGLNVADAGASQRLLSETQKLFSIMQNTFRKAADPREFASCVKGLDSAPIDINIQMDADEFYNLLFDQWEGQMLSPETKQRFRSFYGGQTVNQIKSKECEHVSERVESFFVVQCDVQGKANLQESLQAFVEGDVMEGDNKYKCESCGGKLVDAVKRTCLKDVPDNLIFHLKRFDFDLVDMRRAKINDHFEFPNSIDVSPYNVDHLSDPSKPRREDIFELVGVLVHQGTSENGHYYSYIRERPCPSGSPTSWVEFNDRDVDTFDHQSIPYHTFGGFYDEQFPKQQKQFSAYMLFYQRKSAIEKDHYEYISSPRCGPPKVPVPPTLGEDICADNEVFVQDYCLYDPNHSKFIRQILTTLRTVNYGTCSADHEQETQALHVVLEHLCQVISRLRNIENFDETIIQLRKTVLSCSTCCSIALKWFAEHEYALVGLLLRCLHMKVRSQIRAFLIDSLRFLREKDPTAYGVENLDTDMETGTVAPFEGILVDITRRLRLVASETWISARGWDDFYLTLCQLSNLGHFETAVMLNQQILYFCLRILCMHAYAQFRMEDSDIWRMVEKKKHIYNRLIELVYTLCSKMDLRLRPVPQSADRMEHFDRNISKFPLSSTEYGVLTYWHDENRAIAVLDKMIEQFDCSKTEVFYPGEMIKWMLNSQEPRNQRNLFITIADGVQALTAPFSDPYVRAAVSYCEACPTMEDAQKIIDAVVKSASELRDQGGESHLLFFNALPTLHNEAVFDDSNSDFFYDYALYKARTYSLSLLMYDDEAIRKATAKFLEELFVNARSDEDLSPDSLRQKYESLRRLIREMLRKMATEHDNGTSRNYMQPLIHACSTLVHVLVDLVNNQDVSMEQYKSANDTGLIQHWQIELDSRLRLWVQDEGTPISTGEAYEQSDYGSESDDGPDLEP